MLFYRDRVTTNRDNFMGSIELTSNTKCNIARRGTYNFPFYLNTERGTHLFKCETNLKRHQWMYLIELASKGSPPKSAPLAVPRSTSVQITDDQILYDTYPYHTETDKLDSETDEDDDSIPPGVILVTTPIDDLSSHNNGASNEKNITEDPSLLSRAVLSTGITGTTKVVQEPSSSSLATKHAVKSSAPKLSRSFQHTQGKFSINQKSSNSASFLRGLSPHSAHSWAGGSPERPSSSPSPTFERKFTGQLAPGGMLQDNVRFSRHMVRSAPDIQMLTLEDHI